jgi:hypothetical protein
LFSRGVPQRACLEELVTTHPDMVGAAHREYLQAGAELIETLTFGANRQRLAAWGLEGQVGAFNRRAAQLAREAREVGGRDALVGGSVGPLGSPARGGPVLADSVARAVFREQIEGLLEGGADLIVLETFSDLEQLVLAVDEARKASDVPVIASLTFGEELLLAVICLIAFDFAKDSASRCAGGASRLGDFGHVCSYVFTHQQLQSALRDNAFVVAMRNEEINTSGTPYRDVCIRQRPGQGDGIGEQQSSAKLQQPGPLCNDA